MTWLKKNIFLVVGGVVLLGLLGGVGYLLFTNKKQMDEASAQLNAQTEELKRLVTRDPHPNPDNIEAAKTEQSKLAEWLSQSRKFFVPVATFTTLDSADFKRLLETTISEMEKDAEFAGVNLPAQYNFTFSAQRRRVDFAPETLVPLATQVTEIKALCAALFDARIHALVALRRVPVAKDDEGAADFLLGKKASTNAATGAVVIPYEITFQGFSTELAGVLAGLARSSNCFIVKNIDVQTNVTVALPGMEMTTPSYYPTYVPPGATAPQPTMSSSELMRRRYGLGPRYQTEGAPPPPVMAPWAPPPGRRGPETVLDERPFKVTMFVEAVRLVEPPAKPLAAK